MNNLQVGQVVAFCYRGSHGARRLRNVVITQIKKTYIEINDSSRFSTKDLRMKSDCHGETGYRDYYLDTNVSYWDKEENREHAIQKINTAFENLASSSRNRNWDEVRAAYETLSNLIGESND